MFTRTSLTTVAFALVLTGCSGSDDSSATVIDANEENVNSESSGTVSNDSLEGSESDNSLATFDISASGTFFNPGLDLGGVWVMPLKADNGTVVGSFDATQSSGGKTALCGAGDISSQISGGAFTGQFAGNDSDLGCFFDSNLIFDIQGQVDQDAGRVAGTYKVIDDTGAFVANGDSGIFEAWAVGQRPTEKTYVGEMENTNYGVSGSLHIDIEIGEQTVSGYLDFDEHPGETTLCGAGYFAGLIEPTGSGDWTIHATFESKDADEGCSATDGIFFAIDATLNSSRSTIEGVYLVGGQGGVFTTELKN